MNMCAEASCSFLTKQTDVTYVLNIPPQRHKIPEPCRFKAGDGVLNYFWLTFKVKQGLFCQDSPAVNLCSSESAALHTNANTARAITTSPFTVHGLKMCDEQKISDCGGISEMITV